MTIVYFYSPDCVACRQMKKTLDVVKDYEMDVLLIKQNIYEDQDWAASERINSLPTMLILDENNKQIKRFEGFVTPQKLRKLIEDTVTVKV